MVSKMKSSIKELLDLGVQVKQTGKSDQFVAHDPVSSMTIHFKSRCSRVPKSVTTMIKRAKLVRQGLDQ